MESGKRDLRFMVAIMGLVWCGAFLLVGWTFRHTELSKGDLWNPPANEEIVAGRPIPQLARPLAAVIQHDPLRLALSAERIGREGGSVSCGHAQLQVPRDAVGRDAFFTLETASPRALAVDFQRTATDLVQAPLLKISFAGTQYGNGGLDPSHLQIFREITLGVFQQVPSRVDVNDQCVIAEAPVDGRYVVG